MFFKLKIKTQVSTPKNLPKIPLIPQKNAPKMKPTTSTTTTSTTSKNLYFVRLESKTFWPGELVDPSKYTQEMLEIVEKKAKRKESFLKFVTFPSDED